MLYTLSQAHYDNAELTALLQQLTEEDAVVLWQNGVLQAVKFPEKFAQITHIYALENDVNARGLEVPIETISLSQLVKISEQYYPHIAL